MKCNNQQPDIMVKHHVNGAVWQTLSPLDLINGKLYYMEINITRSGLLQRLIHLTKYKEHTKHTACYSLLFVIVLSRYQGHRNHEP